MLLDPNNGLYFTREASPLTQVIVFAVCWRVFAGGDVRRRSSRPSMQLDFWCRFGVSGSYPSFQSFPSTVSQLVLSSPFPICVWTDLWLPQPQEAWWVCLVVMRHLSWRELPQKQFLAEWFYCLSVVERMWALLHFLWKVFSSEREKRNPQLPLL